MPRRALPAVLAVAVVLLLGAAPAGALTTTACQGASGFRCGTVTVPLDRSGSVPGTVRLAVAVEEPRKGAGGFLLALSGGPGQPSVAFADSFRLSLAPALRHRLVLLDQRGTGRSGALSCPALQELGTLDPVNTHLVEACARKLGPAGRFYSTTDSVLDIEAVRQAIGAPKLSIMGVSYGTYVAVQYARRFPAATDGLILDSVVGPDGIDGYFLDTFERLPRVLATQCAGSRCRGATDDPVGDLGRLTRRLAAGTPLRGTIPAARGARVRTALHDESELLLMIMSGDLNPFLQAALPGAINAATRGDAAPLLRLRRLAQGPATPVSDFSVGLNVATTCADVALPYTWATPFADRWTAWRHGSDLVPESAFAPFSRHAVIDTSVVHDCLRWPRGDPPAAPSAAPLPDVPALLLSGRLDTRTPVENARELLPSLPHGRLLTVNGTGHDVLDSDITGCAAKALSRWADGKSIGKPCEGRDNAVTVLSRPARGLAAYRRAPGVAGDRGRELFAVLDTLVDAQVSALQTVFAGFTKVQGGGLRGGWFSSSADAASLRLHRYQLVPGLRVTGKVRTSAAGGVIGTVAVDGPGRLDGRLAISGGGVVTGTLGGRAVRYQPSRASRSAAGAGRVPQRVAVPSRAQVRRVLARRRAAGGL